MTNAAVGPLRRRMIEDMTIRKFAPRTQEGYIRAVKNFSAFLGASPDKASFEDVRRYRLHLASSGTGVPTINHSLTALRFLFMVTLRQPDVVIHVPFVREPRRLPVVLSPAEVARLLEAAPSLKYRAALSVAYGAGLRASEVVSLKIVDIDSARMVIRVEQGKGRKDRYVMLSEQLLPVPYYHLVFTLPAAIADIAYYNKAVIYDILFKAAAETLITIAADPKHL